jgi:hypothetical protein
VPELPDAATFEFAPDWVCEWSCRRRRSIDRASKLIYAREGVRHEWVVNPRARPLECFGLNGPQVLVGTWRDDAKVRVEPFEEVELELGCLWAK